MTQLSCLPLVILCQIKHCHVFVKYLEHGKVYFHTFHKNSCQQSLFCRRKMLAHAWPFTFRPICARTKCLYYYVFNGYLPKSRVEQKCMRGERPPKRGAEARSRTLVPGTHIAADDREIRNTRDGLRSIYR